MVVKAMKRVGVEHGSVVAVVFGGGIFLSGNFAFCFDSWFLQGWWEFSRFGEEGYCGQLHFNIFFLSLIHFFIFLLQT